MPSKFDAFITPVWTIEDYCAGQSALEYSNIPSVSSQTFLQSLELPTLHPFCSPPINGSDEYYLSDIPRQGPLLQKDHLETPWDVLVSLISVSVVPLASMAELWLRFFALLLAPLFIGVLWFSNEGGIKSLLTMTTEVTKPSKKLASTFRRTVMGVSCFLAMASSMVLLTDTLYVMEFGPQLGGTCLAIATMLSFRTCQTFDLVTVRRGICLLLLLCAFLVIDHNGSMNSGSLSMHFGEPLEDATVSEGLYYDSSNPFLDSVVSKYWPSSARTYSYDNGATPWMVTGDSRTAFPFILNQIQSLEWHRLWLPLDHDDGEIVALDFTFPANGYDETKPVYMLLHGINGGTHENFIKDFARLRTNEGATVCVMVARGLEDLPIRGWNNFHGARWTDAHHASQAIRKGMAKDQLLVGVGYSMGAIILSNLVGRAGNDCALDAAIAVSGGLDLRFQANFYRAQRLFQPIVTVALRGTFVLGKWGERVRARLSKQQMKALMQGTHVTDLDKHCVVNYNGFRDVEHYYSEMSLLGDITMEEYALGEIDGSRRVHHVAVPTVVVHSIDDPLITWRTVGGNEGVLHPSNLTRTGSGNLMILLTEKGGHVGWPLGLFPSVHAWKWMNDIPSTFATAIQQARKDGTHRQGVREQDSE